MPVEIERKFLVQNNSWKKMTPVKKVKIQQGYLSKSKKHTVRIRVTSDTAMVTIKGPTHGMSRAEYEYEIPLSDGKDLLTMCDGPIIDKVRHVMKDDHGQVWEVDEFNGINAGLLVAEIELPSEDTKVALPGWVGQEVTFDKRYTNAYLSAHPMQQG
jgi:adenylate cyclase